MSKISKEGFEQIQVIKSALDSMYDKLDTTLYTKNGTKYESKNIFSEVQSEFEAIAGIVNESGNWEEV
jgi:hypothetical protein